MKRVISIVLIMVMIFSTTTYAQAAIDPDEKYEVSENLMQYLRTSNHILLYKNKNYGYMNFVNNVRGDGITMYFFEMANIFAGTGVEPDKEKYMEVLVNIMATYEMDNASAIAEQQKQDNLKSAKDYTIDIAEIATNAVSLSAKGDVQEWLSIAISGVNNLAGNIDNWIEAFSNLETIVQDYSQYDNFLKIIEQDADGELKEAASALRTSMEKAMEIKLNTYSEISNENFQNYEEYFFEDVFWNALEQTSEYASNADFKLLVDCGDQVVSVVTTLKSSWELGAGIGKLIGNIVIGGEDLANRTMEMRALYDISVILQKKIMEVGEDFVENYSSEKSEELAKEYVVYSNFLIGCRIRGEYCMYSVVASDAGLLSWANKKDAQEAKEWYESQSRNILEIRDAVQNVLLIEDKAVENNSENSELENNEPAKNEPEENLSAENIYIEQAKALLRENAIEEALAVLDEGIKTCLETSALQKWKEYIIENVVVVKEYYYSDGGLFWIIEYEYNELGDRVKKTYVEDGQIKKWYEYQYDDNGNNIKYTLYSSDGTIEKYVEFIYDIKGNLLEEYENKAGDKKEYQKEDMTKMVIWYNIFIEIMYIHMSMMKTEIV